VTNHLRIKICGITNADDARQAAHLGADAIGLNFHAASPRCLQPLVACEIMRALPPFVEAVGVFTDVERMRNVADQIDIHALQWHGESAELTRHAPIKNYGHLIVAFAVHDRKSLEQIPHCLDAIRGSGWRPSAILIDGYQKDLLGGTGQKAPWEMLAGFTPPCPLILAGGLTPENVAEAVRIVRPYGVDVASGVESSPGRKDLEKMKRFIDNARSAAER
jgi:phosphoribosylanthranilate isomerase